jgi:putative MATE family efflux protein
MKQVKSNLTTGKVLERLVSFALPFLFSSFMQAFYSAVDMWTVGRFSTTSDLAAVNIGAQVTQIVTGFCVGISMGTTILIGHCVGAKDKKAADRALGNSVWLFIGLAAILTPTLILASDSITSIMQTPEKAISGATNYIQICGAGIPFIVAYNVISAILRGDGNSHMPMVFIGIACVVNVFGDLLLTGYFGLGIVGVAFATVTAQAVSSVVGTFYIWKKGLSFPITKDGFKPSVNTIRRVLINGLPIAAQDTLINISFIAITVIANTRGITDASAVGVVEKIIQLMFLFPTAMMSALSAFTSQNIGAGKGTRAVAAVRYGILMTLAFGILSCTLSQFLGGTMASFFTTDKDVINSAAEYLKTYSIDCIIVAFTFCLNGYFCGIDKSIVVFIHNAISAFGVRIPLAMLFSNLFADSMLPMGMASPIGSLVSLAICVGYLLWINRTKMKSLRKCERKQ